MIYGYLSEVLQFCIYNWDTCYQCSRT